MDDLIKFMEYLWVQIEDDMVTVGISDEGLESFDEIEEINMPDENSNVPSDEVCGEVITDQGPLNLYSPVDGRVLEINEAVVQNPNLVLEDPYGDGWLFRIEAENPADLDSLPDKLKQLDEAFE